MARALTSEELELVRSDAQFSKLYLAVFRPNTVYTALLNGVPSSNDLVYQITFDTGSGTLTDVKPGMTLYVGSSAGAFDLGMCRIRKAPIAGTFYIGLTSEIVWADDCYLTVVDEFDLWAKHAVSTEGVLTMDVDVAFADQHENFHPVPIMGSHAVTWLDEATVDVEFDASDSWVFDSTISTYAWTAPGSSASSGMATATPTITYNAAGIYRVFLTVTSATGKTTTGVRHVFVYDRDENMPATVFQLAQCVGDYETGGWMFDLTMQAEASLSEIRERSLVVLFAEDWYGIPPEQTKQSIGPLLNRENVVCIGRITGESIRWDRENGLVHFTVQGAQHWLNKIPSFPIDLIFNNYPSTWGDMPLMTVDKALFHLLYWHSTVIESMDFYPTNDALYLPDGKTMSGTLWGQMQDIAMGRLMASAGVDRLGRLFVEIDPQMVPEDDRDFPLVMDLVAGDWQESIEIGRTTVDDQSLLSLSTLFADADGVIQTFYSLAPGHVPMRHGVTEIADRLLAGSQDESNTKAGLIIGWRDNEFPDILVKLAQNNRMIDLWPRQYYGLSIDAENTPREISYVGNAIARRMAIYFDASTGFMHAELNLEAESFSASYIDGDIPGSEDIDTTEFPPIPAFPPLPDFPVILPGDVGVGSEDGSRRVILHALTYGLVYTANFDATSPTWIQINSGLTSTQYTNIDRIICCRNGSIYVASVNLSVSESFIAWSPGPGQPFVIIETETSILEKHPGTTPFISCIGRDRSQPDRIAYIIGSSGGAKLYVGNGSGGFTAGANTGTGTGTAKDSSISYDEASGTWLFTGKEDGALPDRMFMRFSGDGGTKISESEFDDADQAVIYHIRAGRTSVVFGFDYTGSPLGNHLIRTLDNMTTRTGNLVEEDEQIDLGNDDTRIACNDTGQFLMARWNTAGGSKGKSSDYGSSWTALSSLPPSGNYVFAWLGGDGIKSIWGAAQGTTIRRSDDFGSTWENREGNAIADFPLGGWRYIVCLDELYL